MRIAVTGASGFVGGALATALADDTPALAAPCSSPQVGHTLPSGSHTGARQPRHFCGASSSAHSSRRASL